MIVKTSAGRKEERERVVEENTNVNCSCVLEMKGGREGRSEREGGKERGREESIIRYKSIPIPIPPFSY